VTYSGVGAVTLNGGGGTDQLNVIGPLPEPSWLNAAGASVASITATNGNDHLSITGSTVSGMGAPIHYAGFQLLSIDALGGDDQIEATLPIPVGTTLGLDANTGNDQMTIFGDDTGGAWTLSPNQVMHNGSGQVVVSLSLESLRINAGNGADAFTVNPNVTMPTTIDGGGGTNTLDVEGASGNDAISVADSTVTGIGALLAYFNTASQSLHGNDGNDTLVANSKRPDHVFGGNGNDQIDIRDGIKHNDSADGGPGKDKCQLDKKDKKTSC
jgi:hypothetical protein